MVELSHWKFEYPLCDPPGGSGTIFNEAAMIKRNIAPGISENRARCTLWIDEELWVKSKKPKAWKEMCRLKFMRMIEKTNMLN